MITPSDKTFNAFFFVVQLLLWLSRYAKHVFSDSTTTTATTTTHELVAFVWLLLGAQLESAVKEVRQRQTQTSAMLAVIVVVAVARAVTALLCYCGCGCCCCCYYPSLPPTQQRELTTAFILGHFACCVRTLCWPLSGRRRFAIVRGNRVKSE